MKILIDASVFLSAIRSKIGGSAQIFKLGRLKKLRLYCSEAILEEVFNNAQKVGSTQEDIKKLIILGRVSIAPAPTKDQVEEYFGVVSEKDAHVVASAFGERIPWVITLDKKHLLTKKGKFKNLNIVSPAQFLQEVVDKID